MSRRRSRRRRRPASSAPRSHPPRFLWSWCGPRSSPNLPRTRMRRHRELPFGAELVREGVRFRLWAPQAQSVALRLEDPGELPMARAGGGWFELTTAAARAGSRYHYVVDGQAVPDPASRHQPEDVHGPSEVIDPRGYDWRDADWRGRRWEEIGRASCREKCRSRWSPYH